MKLEIIEIVSVLIFPIFLATIFNNFNKSSLRPNLKIVYYKFFILFSILFISSQIWVDINTFPDLYIPIRVLGNLLMAMLVFEFFLVPTKDNKNPDDIVVIHTTILWITSLLFLLICSYTHYSNVSNPDSNWKMNPISDIHNIIKKIYNEACLPKLQNENLRKLPICNLFT